MKVYKILENFFKICLKPLKAFWQNKRAPIVLQSLNLIFELGLGLYYR